MYFEKSTANLTKKRGEKQMKTKKFKLASIIIALMIVLNLGMGVWAFELLTPTAPVEEEHIGCCTDDDIEELEPEMAMSSQVCPPHEFLAVAIGTPCSKCGGASAVQYYECHLCGKKTESTTSPCNCP